MRGSFKFNFHNNNIKIYNNINSKISFLSDLKNNLSIINLQDSSIDNNFFQKKKVKRKSRNSLKEKSINSKNKIKNSVGSSIIKEQISKISSKNSNIPKLIINSNPFNLNFNKKIHSKIEKIKTLSLSSVIEEKKNFLSSPSNKLLLLKPKKSKYLELQKQRNELYNSVLAKTPKNLNIISNNSLYQNFSNQYFNGRKSKQIIPKAVIDSEEEFGSFEYFKNDKKIMKINENIKNEIGSKELRKKINLMKQSMINMNNTNNINSNDKQDELPEKKGNEKNENEQNRNEKNSKIFENNNNNDESQICLKNISKIMDNEDNNNDKYINNTINKHRKIKRIKELYDSFDDEEYEDNDNNEFIISPNSNFIIIFDCVLFCSSMYYLIFVPYFLSKNFIITSENIIFKLILILIDIIYIIDLIFNFFRPYQKFDESFIKKAKFIFIHYLKTWFLFDFIQCIPFFTFFKYIDTKKIYKNYTAEIYVNNIINPVLYILILLKIIKVYKLFNKNLTISKIQQYFSQNEIIDNNGNFLFSIFILLCSLNLCTCLFIFIGRNSYSGWIKKINMQDESYIKIYLASVYFTLVTITTVGYGDITGNSYEEVAYQMFLLIIGTIAYSFVISYFSNYIVKNNQKSMSFQKNVGILEEIRLNNPNLKHSTYKEVLKNLHNEQLYERNDKSLLFDCLPYSLKNKLIMEMYRPFIENFIFFKGTENSDFIVKVITSLKPLLSFKGDILVQEGDFIKEIFFVKKGSLGLNITINKESPEESIKKYLGVNAQGKINILFTPSAMNSSKKYSSFNFDNKLNFLYNQNEANKLLDNENDLNVKEIKLLEIRQNEHFGVSLMFLNERSPLFVKVRTKIAELLILKKMEAIEIHSIYPNIWKRINKKSLYNLEQIKIKIQTELFSIANTYGVITKEKILKSSKNLNNFIKKSFMTKKKKTKDKKKKKSKSKTKKKKNNKLIEEKKKIKINIENIEQTNCNKKEKNNDSKNDEVKFEEKNIEEKKNKINNKINNNEIKVITKDIMAYNNKYITDLKDSNNFDNTSIVTLVKKQNSNKIKKKFSEKELNDFTKSINIDEIEFNNSIIDEGSSSLYNNQRVSSYKTNKIFKNISLSTRIKKDINIKKSTEKDKRTNLKDEKNIIRAFSNLNTTKENSFYLNSSYENLNEITNNEYIKDNKLQSKTKLFLINECSLLKSPLEQNHELRNSFTDKKLKKQQFRKIKNDFSIQYDERSVNSLNLKSNIENNEFNDKPKIDIDKNTEAKRHDSQKSQKNPLINKFSINSPESPVSKFKLKSPKRKKVIEFGVNKKLDIISKNIKGANKNINNPDEFYMDFFNNIIKNETIDNSKKVIKNKNTYDNLKEKIKTSDSFGKQSIRKRIANSMIYHEKENKNKQNQNEIKLKLLKKFEY